MPYPSNVGGVNCGRAYDSEGNILNTTDMIKAIYDALVTNGNAGVVVKSRKSVTFSAPISGANPASIAAGAYWYPEALIDMRGLEYAALIIGQPNANQKLEVGIDWYADSRYGVYTAFDTLDDGSVAKRAISAGINVKGEYADLYIHNTGDGPANLDTINVWARA